MRKAGVGQRWSAVEELTVRRHDLVQVRAGGAQLIQMFQAPNGRSFSVDLTFLSARPELARVLANSFWITYQPAARKPTANRTAATLKLLHRFLDYRAQSQSDVHSAKDLSTSVLKEFAVWLVVERRLKRKSAAGFYAACCCFLRRARRLYPDEFDARFSTPKNLFAGAFHDRVESRALNYVLNSITEPFNARSIQKAQERMIERVTVIPEKRAVGVERLHVPKALARKIASGQFDTSSGACRNPYDSPQPGEEKGRPCTSFHACFSCPNGLWFLEDLPQVIAIRDRLVSLRPDMKAEDWEMVYGESVRIIKEHIIAAFRPEQIRAAAVKAKAHHRPIIVAKGALA